MNPMKLESSDSPGYWDPHENFLFDDHLHQLHASSVQDIYQLQMMYDNPQLGPPEYLNFKSQN